MTRREDTSSVVATPAGERVALSSLPTMAEVHRAIRAQPKAEMVSRVEAKGQQQRDAKKQEAAFRAAVWKAAGGKCEHCGKRVIKTMELVPNAGHVDHIKPRSRAPERKYDPANGRLLCMPCHQRRHVWGVNISARAL